MRYNIILILCSLLIVSACKEPEEITTPAQAQIDEYSKKAKDCETEKKEHEKKPEETAKPVRDFGIAADDMVFGDLNSKVVVVEYFSPTCPHCYGFLRKTYPRIKSEYIDTGKIAYVFREFIGNKQDLNASILARCKGDKESYEKFIEVLLSQQENWAFDRKFEEILTNIGALGGVSPEQYVACLADEELTNILVENTKLPLAVPGFIGTPTFFINGKHFTNPYSYKELSKAIDEEIEKQQ